MLKRLWKPVVGTAALVGAPGYLYFKYTSNPKPRETFDLSVRVRGPDGKPSMSTRAIQLLTKEEVEERLHEHAQATAVQRRGVVWKQHTAYLASNNPIEDANASKIVERDPSELAPPGDLLFFAVMDGHGGYDTSRLLSRVLIPAVALELDLLMREPSAIIPKSGTLASLKAILSPTKATQIPFDANPQFVSLAIQRAFTNLDSEIVDAPLRFLAQTMVQEGAKEQAIPDLSKHPLAEAMLRPAMSGSCALLALFDTAYRNLYVALAGDSRAVAGVWEETPDGTGFWRVDVLTEDQTGRNPNELRRMQAEHPADEAHTVIMRGRVLGGLEPTRAFGDARYKWPAEVQALLNKAFFEGSGQSMRSTPALLRTPPYVTARPVVTHRDLSFLHSPGSAHERPKSAMKFIVLATDGLWDELTSEEVVALVGGHLAGLKGNIAKSELPILVPTTTGHTIEGKDKRQRSAEEGSWAFVDDNVSTHLIRNAFGGGDELKLRQLLSIPSPLSRKYRDDITVTVVYWEDGREEDARTSTFTSEHAKAKL